MQGVDEVPTARQYLPRYPSMDQGSHQSYRRLKSQSSIFCRDRKLFITDVPQFALMALEDCYDTMLLLGQLHDLSLTLRLSYTMPWLVCQYTILVPPLHHQAHVSRGVSDHKDFDDSAELTTSTKSMCEVLFSSETYFMFTANGGSICDRA